MKSLEPSDITDYQIYHYTSLNLDYRAHNIHLDTFSHLIPAPTKSLEQRETIDGGDGAGVQNNQLLCSILCQQQGAPSWLGAALKAQHHPILKLLGQ